MSNTDIFQKYNEILQHIDTGATLLTPNRRLAATLHKVYHSYQLNRGLQSWITPDILPINTWFQRLFENYLNQYALASPLLLTTIQEGFIWEQIISHSAESTCLLQVSKTTEIAQSAWILMKQWHVDARHPLFDAIEDCAAFQRWACLFQKTCKDNHWLDHASLPDILIEKIAANQIALPKCIALLEFTEISPQWKKLFSSCKLMGTEIYHLDFITRRRPPSFIPRERSHLMCRVHFPCQDRELFAIAHWAKTISKCFPDATVGCVIPFLDKRRDRVMQIFSEVFSGDKQYGIPENYPFNISAGKSLTQYPIIHTALQLLMLHKRALPTEIFSYLLRSPFLGEAETERIKRAHFDYLLRKKNINVVYLKSILREQNQISLLKNCPRLANRIQQFLFLLDQQERMSSYNQWVQIFNELLVLLGWPGERSLNSEEYQVVINWFKILSQFAELDHVAKFIDFKSALQMLERVAQRSLFQAQTSEAPVQVLGVLEAAGLPFDFLWIAGMDDLSWPPQAKPNPFIPKRLQRELQMPHATAERELFYCEQITNQFKQNAKQVVFSYTEIKDGLPIRPSPLIQDVLIIEYTQLVLDPYLSHNECIYRAKNLEKLNDEIAPPLQSNDIIPGGVNVIKQQALCPFKAFAEIRLHAQPLESPLPGLRAKDRGTIVHFILEKLWEKLGDQYKLLTMDETNLNELIDDCITQSLSQISDVYNNQNRYFILEKKRLHRLIYVWLKVEKSRNPFMVSIQEKSAQLTLGKLTIAIRIDRIDKLPDGKKFIIDYKTSKHNEINDWFSDRPEDPQLPLYLLIDSHHTIGISFAQLVPGGIGFKGMSQYPLNIKGINTIDEIKSCVTSDWHGQIAKWKEVLYKLSNDFYDGVAHVDPKNHQKTCRWCMLKSLCRINEEYE
ncbi:MAG TPA: PD-(D/E)XK nuclease family protein [Gammaproteobacteria bacterium]|nr:PD-(D/E)XK nuclease family protein [Gammaproteobacteria bacterium]